MKTYPSIKKATSQSFREMKLHTFDKLDGSNLRFEYNKKRGFYKYGTRKRLLGDDDEIFGPAIPLFRETIEEPLIRIIEKQGWQQVVVFCEYWGKESLAGRHKNDDPKTLTVIDVAVYKRGILPPVDFIKLFGEFGPKYLGKINWTRGFIEDVRAGIDGITFEGVVGKEVENKRIVMYKAKTQQWIDKVRLLYAPDVAEKIINS